VIGIEKVMKKMREAPAPVQAPAAVAAAATGTIERGGLSLVATDGQQAPAEGPADPDIERWRVYDLSSKGYGLLVDRNAAELVLLNGLIALRNHESGGWIVGTIVRKLANRVRGEILVGIEVLAYRPIAVDAQPTTAGSPVQGLYLPGVDTNGKLDSIVVRTADFRSDQSIVLKAGGAQYKVRLNRIIRKGADWIKARFEIEAKA
jgi:hypothetical protein